MRHDDVPQIGDHAEVPRVQLELDLLARSGLQVDALKSAECAPRRTGHVGKLQVELDDFISGNLSSVCDCDGGVQWITGVEWGVRQREIAVSECCVAEAESERPEWFALEVAVGAPLH